MWEAFGRKQEQPRRTLRNRVTIRKVGQLQFSQELNTTSSLCRHSSFGWRRLNSRVFVRKTPTLVTEDDDQLLMTEMSGGSNL